MLNAISSIADVMKCDDVSQLEQYLCSLPVQLNVECFEVVPVEFVSGIFIFKEHTRLSMITFVHIVFRKTLCLSGEH